MSLRGVVLSDRPVCRGPRRIEVTQSRSSKPISMSVVLQGPLDNQFGKPIRIDRQLKRILGNRNTRRLTISRRRARKNKLLDRACSHRFKQPKGRNDVVRIILRRILNRFPNIRKRSKMDHRLNAVFTKYPLEVLSIRQLPYNQLFGLDTRAMTHRKVVIYPNLMVCLIEQSDRVRSDVSSTPNDQYSHSKPLFVAINPDF